jgi:hypothetical protein
MKLRRVGVNPSTSRQIQHLYGASRRRFLGILVNVKIGAYLPAAFRSMHSVMLE